MSNGVDLLCSKNSIGDGTGMDEEGLPVGVGRIAKANMLRNGRRAIFGPRISSIGAWRTKNGNRNNSFSHLTGTPTRELRKKGGEETIMGPGCEASWLRQGSRGKLERSEGRIEKITSGGQSRNWVGRTHSGLKIQTAEVIRIKNGGGKGKKYGATKKQGGKDH